MSRLGIIAGSGTLPVRLIEACRSREDEFLVVAFRGQTDENIVHDVPHFWTRLGAADETIKKLKAENVNRIVMAGSMRRPSLAEMRPDWRTVKLFAKLGVKAARGDDTLLRAVTQMLESEGFDIVGAHELVEDLLAPKGCLGRVKPSKAHKQDIDEGVRVAQAIGRLDIGQAAVVQDGVVLGVEAVEGTDELLKRCGKLRRGGRGGVLVKLCKPQQDRRHDLPTIGPDTVRNAAEAGLEGIAVQAGASLVLERGAVIATADEAGIFVIGVEPETQDGTV